MSRPRALDRDSDLGKAMRVLRGCRSQGKVAEQADLDAATVSLYETGRRFPRPATLKQLAKGLGCTQLELEELAWSFRRERLLAEQGASSTTGEPQPEVGESLPNAGDSPSSRCVPPEEQIRAEAREILELCEPILIRLLSLIAAGKR